MICARCSKETNTSICSMFNTDNICLDCKAKEEQHPDYEKAREAELIAIKEGNFNFPGVGKPVDL